MTSSSFDMSTFSYAQAAKGIPGTATPLKTATPSKTPSEENTTAPVAEQTNPEVQNDIKPAPVNTEAPPQNDQTPAQKTDDDDFTTVTNNKHAKSKVVNSRTSSPSVRSKSRKSKEDDSSNIANGSADATEKQGPSDGQAEKAEGAAEKPNGKSEEFAKPTPPKELKAAPLPSVNIWQKRKEAQELKIKTVSKAAAAGKASTKAAPPTDEAQQDSSKVSTKKKGTDSGSDGPKDRKKPESGKARDTVPSVEDSTAWPTPQVAVGEEKKKAQEKTDKSPAIRPHGKEKWTPVPYVPTAIFNTPLPSAGGRGGRRATRGGRDGGRGAYGNGAAGTEKATSGQAAQGIKQVPGERGRQESSTGRAASLPAQSRRSTSTDVGAAADARKATQTTERSHGARKGEDYSKQVNGAENVRPQREGKPSGQKKGGNLAVDPQAAARANGRFEPGPKSADPTGYNDFSRERGGRGSNRGRGGPFSGFGQNTHFVNSAMPNNSFPSPKSFGFNDRQRSQQHAPPNGSQPGNRLPIRSPSLPDSGSYYGVHPFQGEFNNPVYGYPAMNPLPMSAMPYQQVMEPYALHMLTMQLEYYFSVDNMCKDMFLRKQMDSQGFVPLDVLANFKRVKSLTEDFELLRHVARRQLRNIECQTGEDGVDRLRPRDKWQQWVLPLDQREPAAQHDGVAPAKSIDENTFINNHHTESTINGSAPQFVPNGTAKTPLSSTAPEFMPTLPPTAASKITNVGYPMDPPLFPKNPHPEDSTSSCLSLSGEYSSVDKDPACGLDFQSEPPSPSDLETTVDQMSSDAEYFLYQGACASRPMRKPFATAYHPERRPREKGRPLIETFYSILKKIDVSCSETSNGRGRSVARRSYFENPQSYEFWSPRLAKNFHFDLYNHFRRSALDDLLTRHFDYGFNTLMGFRVNTLLGHGPIPDSVLKDMVCLPQKKVRLS